ncbi:LPS export ABC transporter permease LptG [Glaciecola petra]|uniref:LPS export ABC transporter permease LptG n=1 Tax=Glaciecola petra TaxID=3075602 RepID=A0ABU2ZTP7_9ALTE|nr:LPS export ABC transporter permease LptG [Aestuariibacter sp. P117]MDT0596023.1 LPS export ABC transporter permease LptG [Aestuariibacter sp. P117]
MFKLIDLYIGRTLLSTVTITLSVLVGLSALIKFVEQLRRVGQGDYDMTLAALYVLLSLPREIELFLPMATLLGALIGMGLLAQSSELVVMQCAGLSRGSITMSAMKSMILVIIALMALGEWVTPESEAKAKQIRTQALSGGSLLSSDSLTWAKDGNDFVSIGDVINQNTLQDVNIYKFDNTLKLTQILSAKQAVFDLQNWQLNQVERVVFDANKISNSSIDNMIWESSITPDKLGVVAIKPEALSIRGLQDYVNYLQNNGQDSARYELAFWRKILQPVSVAVMLLLAMSFIFGPLRSVTMGARTIMGVLAGFVFFIANEMFGQVSLVFQISPILGAILPSSLFALVAVVLLKR